MRVDEPASPATCGCGAAIEKVFGRWYHIDHHLRQPKYDHPATPEQAPVEVTARHHNSRVAIRAAAIERRNRGEQETE